jgi:hypothetical protein
LVYGKVGSKTCRQISNLVDKWKKFSTDRYNSRVLLKFGVSVNPLNEDTPDDCEADPPAKEQLKQQTEEQPKQQTQDGQPPPPITEVVVPKKAAASARKVTPPPSQQKPSRGTGQGGSTVAKQGKQKLLQLLI